MDQPDIQERLNALMQAGRAVASSADHEQVLQSIVREAAAISGAPFVRLFLLDEASQVLRCRIGVGLPREEEEGLVVPLGHSFSGEVIATGRALAIPDTREDPRLLHPSHAMKWGMISYLGIPLTVEDRPVGVLVFNTGAPRTYTDEEITFLSAFAQQATIAIERTRLQERIQRRADQLATLNELTRSLMASLDPERVGQDVLRAVQALIPEASGRLWDMPEGDEGKLHVIASVGLQDARGGSVQFRRGEGLAGIAAMSLQPVSSRDVTQDPRFINKAWAAKEGIRSAILFPLIHGERTYGILAVFTREVHEFSVEELALLQSLASHASVALANAHLHEAAVYRGQQLEALLKATGTVMSELTLQGILEQITKEASRIAGCEHIKLLLVDREARVLRIGVLQGRSLAAGFPLPLGTGLSGIVAETGRPLFVPDTWTHPDSVLAEHDKALGIRTYLGLPIKCSDEVLGVLTFNTEGPRWYAPEELEYLASFADHAALAIVHARLHEKVEAYAAELESRVKERTTELEEALRVKGEFLARMSHEFRTPLNFVLGFADLLARETAGPLAPTQARYVNRIQMGGRHLLDLVNNLLDLASFETSPEHLQMARFPLRDLAQDILDLLEPNAAAKHLTLMLVIPGTFQVVGDRAKVGQILRHLVSNAVKFTSDGGTITIAAKGICDLQLPICDLPNREAQSQIENRKSQMLEISVTDTGIGIVPEDLDRVFGVFEQADGSTERTYGGSGLGLTLVRKLVDLHGGTVWAESPGAGQGTRVIVRLPQRMVPATKRILVVEDDPTVLRVYSVFLGEAGYGVTAVWTARAALDTLQRSSVDLMILDLGLPDGPGIDLLRQVRADTKTKTLPVLVITGRGEPEVEEALRLGANECLTKPVPATVLVRIVNTILEQAQDGASTDNVETDRGIPGVSDGV